MAGPSQEQPLVWGRLSYSLPNSQIDQAPGSEPVTTVQVTGNHFSIGRAKGCNLQIGIKMISGRHCFLERESNGRVYLVDTSTNGTFVNDHKVSNGQRQKLNDGDKLFLVRKRVDSNQDFHVTFHFILDQEQMNPDLQLDSEISEQPNLKKFKAGEKEMRSCDLRIVTVKSEPMPQQEDQLHAPREERIGKETVKEETPARDLSQTEAASHNSQVVAANLDSMEETFKCSLCLEILHDPLCIQPCMHCYCSGCYSEWMAFSQNCPQCRCPVQRFARNHMISSLLEAFLKSHPEKRRSQAEINNLNSKNSVTKEMLSINSCPLSMLSVPQGRSQCPSDCDCDRCQGGSYSSDSEVGVQTTFHYQSPSMATLGVCSQCPGHVVGRSGVAGKASKQEPIAGCSTSTETEVKVAAFVCGPQQAHLTCSCCFQRMPDRTPEAAAVKPQKCSLCHKVFCHLYLGCVKTGCPGCLNTFSELSFSKQDLTTLVQNNVVETRILMDYEESLGKSSQDTVQSCLDRLDSGLCTLAVNINSQSVLCHSCGLLNLRSIAHDYRIHIPTSHFPVGVTSRPDCYWGMNCRTQKHNMVHAQRYNHICNQTRF